MSERPGPTARFTRRSLIVAGVAAGGAYALGRAFWDGALVEPAQPGEGPYGPLGAADRNGIRLPEGFSARAVARGNEPLAGTAQRLPHVRPIYADGQATFATDDGGWILVTNSEVPMGRPRRASNGVLVPDLGELAGELRGDARLGAGVAAIRFDNWGRVVDAYRILEGTDTNCAGGLTPWGTWLSCEEIEGGRVWECDPAGEREPVELPALGTFKHEAAVVDPVGERVYMSEDLEDGGFYRFTPDAYPDLSSGALEIATVDDGGGVSWTAVPDPSASSQPTRLQVPAATEFHRGEGMWFDSGVAYLATTSDGVVHAYDTEAETIGRIYEAAALEDPPLTGVDNLTVSAAGDIYVAEDNDAVELDIGLITRERTVSRFLTLTGPGQLGSEITGPVFDPSGTRLYFSSQRADRFGITYEVSGPFRGAEGL